MNIIVGDNGRKKVTLRPGEAGGVYYKFHHHDSDGNLIHESEEFCVPKTHLSKLIEGLAKMADQMIMEQKHRPAPKKWLAIE